MQLPNEIAILKSIWRKDEKGAWTVHDSQALTLRPRAGFDARYFKVKNDVNLLTSHPGKIFENVFATFGTTEFLKKPRLNTGVSNYVGGVCPGFNQLFDGLLGCSAL
jgi:hypothetical protein